MNNTVTHHEQTNREYASDASRSRHDPVQTARADDFYHWVYAQLDGLTHQQPPNKGIHKDNQ